MTGNEDSFLQLQKFENYSTGAKADINKNTIWGKQTEMDLKQNKLQSYAVFLFFIALLTLGTFFFKDYGISCDEPIERENGIYSLACAYRFFTGDSMGLDFSRWVDRYYGNGLQHLLLLADYLCGCFCVYPFGNAMSWLLRHWLTFVFMLIGLFFMYRTGCLLWRSKVKALIPVVLFLFIPRFVAESFYNIKDIGLLSGMMIGGYFMVRCALHTHWLNVLLLGVVAAFVCSIRLVGLQFFAAGIVIVIFMDALCRGKWDLKKIFLHLLCLLISFSVCIILFYPACWSSGPLTFFSEAVSYMTRHPWSGTVRFCGRDYAGGTTPWYYLAVWIGVTTPLPILFLLFSGSVCIVKKYCSAPLKFLRRRSILVLLAFFLMFWGELLLMPFLLKNYYNGWRQFYFLGYPMLIIAGCGIITLFKAVARKRFLKYIAVAAVIAVAGLHITWMISQHPYQYLYFNALATDPQNDFELDYWSVSNMNGIQRILDRNVNDPETKTIAFNGPIFAALSMFSDKENDKLHIVSRYGSYDYAIIINDSCWSLEKLQKKFPLKQGRKIISEETAWVKNSLWTRQCMIYRLVEFEKIPEAVIKTIKY